MWVYFWTVYSVLLIYLSILLPISHSLNYCSFIVVSFEICSISPPTLFFNTVLAILYLFPLHINFRICLPISTNELVGIFFLIFIYLFMAVLGLRFCARAFSSCGERGPLFIAVRGPLTVAASLVVEHRLQTRRLSNCGSRGPVAPRHVGSSQTRARTRVPCIGRQTLNHCATREAPLLGFWLGLQWIYKSSWEELTSWWYWLFLFRSTGYLSRYLISFIRVWEFFSYSSYTYFVRFIPKYFILGGANVNDDVVFI